jgi:hypothetical protein
VAIRTIVHEGTEWTAWDVVRTLQGLTSVPLPDTASAGWLCFQSLHEKRRLVPAPEGWELWSDDQLAAALRGAQVVRAPGAAWPELSGLDPGEERELRFRATLSRARELGARVRRAMEDGGASPPSSAGNPESEPPLPLPR